MRGSYKPSHWHRDQVQDISTQLNAAGLAHTLEWQSGEQAVFRYEGKKFLIHGPRRVMVLDEALPDRLRGYLLDALPAPAALPEPAYGMATLCVLIYAGLQLLVIANTLESEMPALLAALLLGYAGLAGGLVWGFNLAASRAEGSAIGPLLIALPGFLMTSPSALLLMPLVLNMQLESLHSKLRMRAARAGRQDLLRSAAEAG